MELTAKLDIPGFLIVIDFRKVFDSLELNFLQKFLESFNFGPNFIRWVMTFYKNIQSCVINSGITSNYFAIKRGVSKEIHFLHTSLWWLLKSWLLQLDKIQR